MMERKQIGSVLYLHGGRPRAAKACVENSWDFQVRLPCGKGWQVREQVLEKILLSSCRYCLEK
jgi:hypothetical protein